MATDIDVVIKSDADSDLLDKVESESYQVILQQRKAFNRRWNDNTVKLIITTWLRISGLLLSIVGLLLSIFYLLYPKVCPGWFQAELFILLFVLAIFVFYFLPRLEEGTRTRLEKNSEKSCRKIARKFVASARKLVPFKAEYIVKGNLVSYFRGKDEHWKQAWVRNLKGYAVVNNHVTLFFRKPGSLYPVMLIFYEDDAVIKTVLTELGLSFRYVSGDCNIDTQE